MCRLFLKLLIFCLTASCSFRIYENGHFVTRQLPKPTSDSILVVSIFSNAKIPEATTEISRTTIKAPLQKYYDYDLMVTYAKDEASRLGGNVIKVTNYHSLFGTKYLKQTIHSTIYKMDLQTLSYFKTQLDSIDNAHSDSIKHISIVHLKDYDDIGERSISFNDTLVTKIKRGGISFKNKSGRKDLVFYQNGTLMLGKEKLNVEIGNEYYVFCSQQLEGVSLIIILN